MKQRGHFVVVWVGKTETSGYAMTHTVICAYDIADDRERAQARDREAFVLLGKDLVERVRVEHPIEPTLDLLAACGAQAHLHRFRKRREAFGELPLHGLQLA